MSEVTQETPERKMPWWGTLGWVMCGLMTVLLVVALAERQDGEDLNVTGLIPWGIGFVLGVAGLIVKGVRR